jgi:mRNA-degrading endonuclease RelE of RelBE toxin-antitoxin system
VVYSVALAPAANRQFRKLPALVQQRLKPHIDSLAGAPRPVGSLKMHGEPNLYRAESVIIGSYTMSRTASARF